MKRILVLLLAVLLLASLFMGCTAKQETVQNDSSTEKTTVEAESEQKTESEEAGSEENTEQQDEFDPNQVSGEVNIYIVNTEELAIALKEGFEAAYPNITLNYVLLPGGEVLTRLRAEKDNPQADMVCGGGADVYMNADSENLFMPFVPKATENYEEGAVAESGGYVLDLQNILGICYDKDWYDANGIAYPTTWDDLLIPELQDNVILTNVGTSTTGYMMMATLISLRGEEAGLQYMVDVGKNVKSYAKSGSGPVNSVSLGEAAAGVSYIPYIIQLQEQGYTNLGICVPTEGTCVEKCGVAVINNCKNADAAKVYEEWFLSEGLKLFENYGVYITPMTPDIPIHEGLEEYAKQLNDVNIDYVWAAENKDRLTEAWDALVSSN